MLSCWEWFAAHITENVDSQTLTCTCCWAKSNHKIFDKTPISMTQNWIWVDPTWLKIWLTRLERNRTLTRSSNCKLQNFVMTSDTHDCITMFLFGRVFPSVNSVHDFWILWRLKSVENSRLLLTFQGRFQETFSALVIAVLELFLT